MSDLDGDDQVKDRHTGAAAEFVSRAARAAREKTIAANQARTDAVALATQQAQGLLAAAHETAAAVLGQNLKSLFVLTDAKATLLDATGAVTATFRSEGAANLAVDEGAERLHWAQVGRSSPQDQLPPAPGSRPDSLRQGEVALYEHYNYEGRVWMFNVAVTDFRLFPGMNDQVSSLKVGPNTTVTLFEHVGFGGRSQSFAQSTPVLGGTTIGNDSASSLQLQVGDGSLRQGQVALYQDLNFQGQRWVLSAAQADFRSVPGLNDQASSIRVGPNTAATLFADVGFQGASQEFTSDVAWLGDTAVRNDAASSLQLRVGTFAPRQGEVALYQDMNYQGRCWLFSADVSDFRAFEGLNDQVSSVRIGPNTAVTLFEHVDFRGRSQTFQGDFPWLADTSLGNDVASSLRLSGRMGALSPRHVALYEHYDFQGRVWQFNADVTDFRVFEGLNDQVSSIRVGPNTTARLYEHVGMQGRSQELSKDTPNLSVTSVGNDTTSSLVVGTPRELHLASAEFDGRQAAVVARAPVVDAVPTLAGSVAVDTSARFIFWIVPSGVVVRTGFDGNPTQMFQPPGGLGVGRWGIALDPVNKKVYWSKGRMIGVVRYDGSGGQALLVSPTDGAPRAERVAVTVPQASPGEAPVKLTVDPGRNLYWNDGRRLWRAGLDGSNPVVVHRPPLAAEGLDLDPATKLLYWSEGSSVVRALLEPTLTPELVFALPSLEGTLLGITVVTMAGTATQRLNDAQATRQSAHDSAAQSVDRAHQLATTRRQDAQTNLQNAHSQATQSIADKRLEAANRRQAAQDGLQQAHTRAGQTVNDAEGAADAKRVKAHADAQKIRSDAQQQADATVKAAQDKLGDARRQQQSS